MPREPPTGKLAHHMQKSREYIQQQLVSARQYLQNRIHHQCMTICIALSWKPPVSAFLKASNKPASSEGPSA